MTNMNRNEIAFFAALHHVNPAIVFTLPVIFEASAKELGKSLSQTIAEVTENKAAADYIISVANKAAKAFLADQKRS